MVYFCTIVQQENEPCTCVLHPQNRQCVLSCSKVIYLLYRKKEYCIQCISMIYLNKCNYPGNYVQITDKYWFYSKRRYDMYIKLSIKATIISMQYASDLLFLFTVISIVSLSFFFSLGPSGVLPRSSPGVLCTRHDLQVIGYILQIKKV